MDDELRKTAENSPEFQEYGGALDDEGVLSPEEIERLVNGDEDEELLPENWKELIGIDEEGE